MEVPKTIVLLSEKMDGKTETAIKHILPSASPKVVKDHDTIK